MRKPAFSICKSKGTDQLYSYCAADQCLCFPYIDSATPLLPISEFSSLYPSSVTIHPGRTWSETQKTGFLVTQLIFLLPRYQQAFLAAQIAGAGGSYWIGLGNGGTYNSQKWVSGETVTYTSWSANYTTANNTGTFISLTFVNNTGTFISLTFFNNTGTFISLTFVNNTGTFISLTY